MNAQRKAALVLILEGTKRDIEGYPMALALSNLAEYYFAGMFTGALQAIEKDTGVKEAAADKRIEIARLPEAARVLASPAVRGKMGELQSKIDALSDAQALELRHFEFLLRLCHHLGLNKFLLPLGARVASQDGPLLGSVALTACCRRSTSASLSATWARFGSSSRAR